MKINGQSIEQLSVTNLLKQGIKDEFGKTGDNLKYDMNVSSGDITAISAKIANEDVGPVEKSVKLEELLINRIKQDFGKTNTDSAYDFDKDGDVDGSDLAKISNIF